MLSGRGPPRVPSNPQQHTLGGPKRTSIHRRLLNWAKAAFGLGPRARQPPIKDSPAPEPAMRPSGRLRLAIVGDVHGSWQPQRDEAALQLLAPDLTLLVGDFGNENLELVKQIAALPLPKAVILGNHDAWYSLTSRSNAHIRRGAVRQMLSAADILTAMDRGEGTALEEDGVSRQLAELADCHVGYRTIGLEAHGYTVVGARPFSKGGKNFTSIAPFMERMYGVKSMDESAKRIVRAAQSAPEQHALIVMGHNGPAGLGARHFDPCGVDWEPKAGDHGDPDMQAALASLQAAGRRVALVTFGHMHHNLHPGSTRGTGNRLRRMVAVDPDTGTVFLNAATVPRVIPAATIAGPSPPPSPPSSSSSPRTIPPRSLGSGKQARVAAKAAAAAAAAAAATAVRQVGSGLRKPREAHSTVHHFLLVELAAGEVLWARDVWVQVTLVTDATAAAVLEATTAAAAAAAAINLTTTAATTTTSAVVVATGSALTSTQQLNAGGGRRDLMTEDKEGPNEARTASNEDTVEESVVGTSSWASIAPRRIGNFIVQVAKEHVVLRTVVGVGGGVVKFVWNAYDQRYESHVMREGTTVAKASSACKPSERVTSEAGVMEGVAAVVGSSETHGPQTVR